MSSAIKEPCYFEGRFGGVSRFDTAWSPKSISMAFRRMNDDGQTGRAESVTAHLGTTRGVVVAFYNGEPKAFRVGRGTL